MKRLPLLGWFLLCINLATAQPNRGVKLAVTHSTANGKRTALLIGNADYQNAGSLRNPLNDVKAMTAALRDLGFTVVPYANLNRESMERAINAWGKTLPNYSVALFYYAGHGAEVGGVNYLFPTDVNPQNQAQVKFQAHPVDLVMGWMEEARVTTNIVLLDACRNNPFGRSWSRSLTDGGLANMTAPTGTFVGFAASPGSTAADGNRANGLYTEAILRTIKQPNLTIDQVFNRVNQYVRQQSNGAQVPFKNSSLEDDFYFSVIATATKPESVQAPSAGVTTKVTRTTPAKPLSTLPAPATRKFLDLPFADMAYVAGGSFSMGTADAEISALEDELPVHTVQISSFWLGKYEVTQQQWASVMGTHPAHFKGCDDCPIEKVSWNDAQAFLQKLNKNTGMKYRLPTEAEWEFAARERGKPVRFGNGEDTLRASEVNFETFSSIQPGFVIGGINREKTMPVGSFKPNELGLYDMSGNVEEFCSDWYNKAYYKISPAINPKGPDRADKWGCGSGGCRSSRGGSWKGLYYTVSTTTRSTVDPAVQDLSWVGFRIAHDN
ncbi:SUMF1/EgtB/PvdO family nonheme iron enzyme [Spirosoma areae]